MKNEIILPVINQLTQKKMGNIAILVRKPMEFVASQGIERVVRVTEWVRGSEQNKQQLSEEKQTKQRTKQYEPRYL